MLSEQIRKRMLEAMKAGRDVEKSVLRVALGEIQSSESRTGNTLDDEGAAAVLRKLVKSNTDTIAAGADVPRPLATAPNAILMEYVGDAQRGAPILHSLRLDLDEARELFDRLIENVEILLECYRVHADLSAYNVLYWKGDIRIIDFPQVIDAYRHPDAFGLFARDVDRLCRYFARCGLPTDPVGLAYELWGRWIG